MSSHVQQKLYEAVDCLIGSGELKDRLRLARAALATAGHQSDKYRDLNARLERLMAELRKGDSATDEQGESLAKEIFALFLNYSARVPNPTGL